MATKSNPGPYDCYANAEPDEPLFVLLARDPTADCLVRVWRALRAGDLDAANEAVYDGYIEVLNSAKPILSYDAPKLEEALRCFQDMRTWRRANRPKGGDK